MRASGPVAIIGAGISGLSCARSLRSAGVEVRVFEEANRVGGRCATRLWQGHLVDDGVQYFTARTSEFKRELLMSLRQFRPIIAPVLDAVGKTLYSASGPRFYVIQGNNFFAHVLSRGVEVRVSTRVEAVTPKADGLECDGQLYRAVVSALPAPQTARLFALEQAGTEYASCLSVVLEYGGAFIGESEHCYGRIGAGEPVASSYCENHKAGRILGDKSVFVVQSAAEFSVANAERPAEDFIPELARMHEEMWKIPSGKRTAAFGRRWLLSRSKPDQRRELILPDGAFVCGDSRSESTVEDVWLDGRSAAEEVLAYLKG